ncbi:YfcC family protein [Spiroplasma apis]|uniref:Arginine/ornithine antiporter n=1 Tax=Spiroplasma apis B31 TaxID=1276258 RepID=V5RHR1_SPIAP|nr:YfcC family protein [Spiroplasma apis]AHB36074.1 arginine/ornithine antiporter [Spiroplasma apis B31]
MDEINTKKRKRKFRMPTAFTILFFIILFIVVLSWILGGAGLSYDKVLENGDVEKTKLVAVGVLDVFYSVMKGFVNKAEVIIFILALGGFILVLMESKALDAFTQSLAKKFSKNSIWLIPILMTFFSFCGSTYGMAEESLGFYMILIPLMLSTGFDKFTGLMIVLFGAGTGVLASTVNPFVIALAESSGNLKSGDGMAFRWISWIVFTAVGVGYVMWYASRVKKNPQKSVTFSTYEGDKVFFLGEKQEEVPFNWKRILSLVVFAITFILMVLYLVGWDSLIKGADAKGAGDWMNKHIPWLTALIPGFGSGYLVEVATFFLIAALFIGFLNWRGEKDFVERYIDGTKDLLGVCLIIATAAGVGVILEATQMNGFIIKTLSDGMGGMNKSGFVIVSFLIFLPLSFLIPSTSGFAAAIFPIWGPLATSVGAGSGSILAFSFASGVLNLFTPTSGVVMGSLGIARIDYGKFIKGSWIYIALTAGLSIIMLGLGSLLPAGTIF